MIMTDIIDILVNTSFEYGSIVARLCSLAISGSCKMNVLSDTVSGKSLPFEVLIQDWDGAPVKQQRIP